ncbi:AAA family ATPase [Ureibacillus chungkukjangi]|uniref:AAA domain-containing protein n=1 Tax=Ureibacillus chungkukjangi TaxID=1202712 RepID=A0A318TDG2_9BACL|nr:AAA family ATPase [Ureibacillus chungkukjangi]MCM3390304.1 AAA family ATPase [Ureibacillus chungkukjangi]PYF02656.1 AAA domain-containing protein [Ureibacillus chungkukjangi]
MELNNHIWEWSLQLPKWQNDLIRRLYQKSVLDSEELKEVIDNILYENGFTDKNFNITPLEESHIPNKNPKDVVKITSLKNLQHIAAIDSEYGIQFSPDGLTVIYGENSAGKSSYAKVLKQACRAVDEKTKIYPNIYKSGTATSTADIYTQQNGSENIIKRIVNTAPESQLTSISIFDTDCARVYAQSENEVVFIPTEFKIFDVLATLQTEIRHRLLLSKEALLKTMPTFNELTSSSKVENFINSITYQTKDKDVRGNCIFTKEDQTRLEQISSDLKVLSHSNPLKVAQELQRNISDITNLKNTLQNINQELSNGKVKDFIFLNQRYLDSKATLEALTHEAFEEQPLNEVGSNPWKKLWQTAKQYHEIAYPQHAFPNVENDAKCLLCQQDLKEDARIRLTRFEEFMNDSISQETRQLHEERRQLLSKFKLLPFTKVTDSSVRTYLYIDSPELDMKIELFIQSAVKIVAQLQSVENDIRIELEDVPLLESFPIKELDDWLQVKCIELEHLKSLVQQDNSAELKAEQYELISKEQVFKRIEDVYNLIKTLQQVDKFDKAIKSLDTTKLTRKYNELSNSLLTDKFKEEIENELKQLRREHILFKLNSRGVKGKTTLKLSLESSTKININEILSEGEQKVLSLAFFLAEISSMHSNGGIILDDPVSSLDHSRRDYVAKRLIVEAKRRQVIIFTHDIVFLHTLQKYAKLYEVNASYCSIRRHGQRAGIAKPEMPWITLSTSKRIGYLKNELPKLKKQESQLDPDIYYRNAKTWYMLLRESWERAVEELLLNGVVERFDSAVQTQRLNKIKFTDEIVQLVNEGMTKSSTYVHDESHAIGRIIPSNDEMIEDLNNLEYFSKLFK